MVLETEDTLGLQDLKMFFDVEHGLFCTYQKVREVYMACRAPLKQTNKQRVQLYVGQNTQRLSQAGVLKIFRQLNGEKTNKNMN